MDSGNNDIENKLIDTFKIWLLLITTATCIGILTSGPFLTFFAGKQFVEVRKIFPYLLVAFYAGSFYFFFSTPIFYFKKTKYLPIITGTSALINISLNFILIPKYGIYGASIATIISHVWISALGYIIGNKLFRIQWPFKEILTSIIFVSVTLYIISI
jgi:O-antigen/teichoic acid export membrane protein